MLRIKGSDTIGGKLMPDIAESYHTLDPQATLAIEALGSATAFVGLFDGSADIGEASRPINESERARAKALNIELHEIVIGYDGVAVIVNPDNPIRSLTIADLSDVFTGKVKNWRQLGGHALPILVISRPSYSGTNAFFKEKALRRGNPKGPEEYASTASIIIVGQHRGRIDLTSRVGGGTSFRVTLPLLAGAVSAPKPQATSEPVGLAEGHGERVLVVEDERATREGLLEVLNSLSYDVTAVGSGEEAGRLTSAPAFDLLLTDLMLPGVAGPDLARGLKEHWPALKVILMSGYTEDEAVRRGVKAGEVRFLQKPFDMAALAREVRAALDERPGVPGD